METFSSTLRKEILYYLAAMDRGPIPNDEQLPCDLAQQELQEPHHIWPFVGVILDLHYQLALGSQGSYGRKMIVGQRNAQDRRLPTRRVGAHGQGQQVKGGLIDPHQGSLFLLGFFLTRPSVLLSRPGSLPHRVGWLVAPAVVGSSLLGAPVDRHDRDDSALQKCEQ